VTAAPDARTAIPDTASIMSAPLAEVDPDIAELLDKELHRQRDTL
jgi:glycine hydroxymethyltransferase